MRIAGSGAALSLVVTGSFRQNFFTNNLLNLISRYFAGGIIEKWVLKEKLKNNIEELMAAYGWRIVLISRLVPVVPLNLQNYAYGLTSLSFILYLIMSAVGILPKVLLLSVTSGVIIEGESVIRDRPQLVLGLLVLVLIYFLLYHFFLLREDKVIEKIDNLN